MKDQNRNFLIEKAEESKKSGQHQEAILLCEKILEVDLDCQEAYEEIGDNYLSLRDYQKAERALIQALRINPDSANAHYLLGFTYSALNLWSDSIAHLEKADLVYKNHPEILRCLGWSYFHSGKKELGIVLLERSLSLAPNDPLIQSDLGICYLNFKNFYKPTPCQ